MRIGAMTMTLAFAMGFAFLIVAGVPPVSDAGPCDDSDNDGICLEADTCSSVTDATNLDVDADGYGNICDFDYNNDCAQDGVDFDIFRPNFLIPSPDPNTDADGSGTTDGIDFDLFRPAFFGSPGPTGLVSAACGS
jgi:hypothetical protein